MDLKKYTTAGPKSVSEKSNLKFYILFNIISFANAQSSVNFIHKKRQIFLFYNSRCGKCSLEIMLLTK